jgi:PPM family protein phosphatase
MSRLAEYWKKVSGSHVAVPTQITGSHGISSEDPRRRLESFGLSHVGKVREGNEDHFVIASLQRSLEVRQTNFEKRELLDPLCGPKAYLFAVADGVGGLDGGKLASGLTIQTIVEYLSETVGSYHAVPAGQEHAFLDPLGRAVQRAQEKLLSTFGLPQGGPSTTLTIALVVWPKVFIVHVGDSRAYRLHDGRLTRLTRDQTMGAYLMDEYKMSEEQVEQGGFNNVLASAVGSPEMTPTVSELTLERGDVLLLCTDGLTKHVSEEQIAGVLGRSNPESSCRSLVDLALEGGGLDNVTVVVANTLTA